MAVVGGILGDQDDLSYAHLLQGARFGQDRLNRAADGGALDQRDGAESARAAAAIGDLQIGTGTLHREAPRTVFVAANGGRFGQVIARFGVPDAVQALNYINNIHPAACTEDAINARNTTGNFDGAALRQAACGDQHLAVLLLGSQIGEYIERLLSSQADETAGVDDQDARPARVSDKLIARTDQQLRHGIRVNGVL